MTCPPVPYDQTLPVPITSSGSCHQQTLALQKKSEKETAAMLTDVLGDAAAFRAAVAQIVECTRAL